MAASQVNIYYMGIDPRYPDASLTHTHTRARVCLTLPLTLIFTLTLWLLRKYTHNNNIYFMAASQVLYILWEGERGGSPA